MASTLSKNLDRLMIEANLSAEELGRRLDLPASTIKKIRTDKQANPTVATLKPIAKYFLLSISELIGDEPISAARFKGSYHFPTDKVEHIPILNWNAVKNWPLSKPKNSNYINSEYSYSKNAFALTIEESGWENLAIGTIIIIDPSIQAAHKDFVIILKKKTNKPSLKQILIDDEIVYLKSIIPGYKMIIKNNEHIIAGVVMEYKKLLRR